MGFDLSCDRIPAGINPESETGPKEISWQPIKLKVPGFTTCLTQILFTNKIKVGQKCFIYFVEGTKKSMRLNFPLHLWVKCLHGGKTFAGATLPRGELPGIESPGSK